MGGSNSNNSYDAFIMKTDSLGWCLNNDSLFDFQITDVKQKQFNVDKLTSRIYPNPFTATCKIHLPAQTNKTSTLNLYSITGKLLRQKEFTGNSYEFKREDLSGGLYLYKIISGKNVFTGKLVVSD